MIHKQKKIYCRAQNQEKRAHLIKKMRFRMIYIYCLAALTYDFSYFRLNKNLFFFSDILYSFAVFDFPFFLRKSYGCYHRKFRCKSSFIFFYPTIVTTIFFGKSATHTSHFPRFPSKACYAKPKKLEKAKGNNKR